MSKNKKHTLPPKSLELKKALHNERHLFEKAQVPIVTVSASYRKELADKYHSIVHSNSDVVYSRAHYSMAEAVREEAKKEGKKSVVSDPLNFASIDNWKSIEFAERVGKAIARYKILRIIKDKLNFFVRSNTPIAKSVTEPLLYLTGKASRPIISMHYETGNILATSGKKVIQAVTDPYVHPQYLDTLPNDNIVFAVFDERTKKEFLKLAKSLGKKLTKNQIVVTGAFVDPRVRRAGKKPKKIIKGQPINLAITTGGLGTNLPEIKRVLEGWKELLIPPEKIRLFLYAGTHRDFRNFFEDFAKNENIRIGNLDDEDARIRILYDDSIVDANENLIRYMFPWAHGIVTKPSGDMAYDAAAAGSFIFFLEPWGVWEERAQKIFIDKGIGFDLNTHSPSDQFLGLLKSDLLENATQNTGKLPTEFLNGSKNIIKLQQSYALRRSYSK